jgi:hypothetical protein
VPFAERVCAHCGTPIHPAQAWCLHCGAPETSALSPRSPRGPLRALAVLAAVLAAGAAVAGAAVLTRHHPARRLPSLALVRPAAPGAGVGLPAGAPPATPPAGSPGSSHRPSPNKNLFPPPSAAKPPKIPAAAPTPEASGGAGASEAEAGGLGEIGGGASKEKGPEPSGAAKEGSKEKGSGGSSKEGSKEGSKESGAESGGGAKEGSKEGSKESGSAKPTPLVLDTNAASAYNPYNYPASSFGDPSLAIDGELSTPWTASVQPASFPKMAAGLLIDLRTPTAVGGVELVVPRASLGMTVEIFGAASAKKPPASITARGWTLLSKAHVLRKKTTLLHLRAVAKKFRWITVWITKASAASQGTVAAPGFVSLDEVSFFPPASGR